MRTRLASLLIGAILLLPCGCSKGGGGGSTTQNIGGVRYTPGTGARRVNANAQLKKQQETRAKQEAFVRQLNGEEDTEEENYSSKKKPKDNGLFSN